MRGIAGIVLALATGGLLAACEGDGMGGGIGSALLAGAKAGLVEELTGEPQANPYLNANANMGGLGSASSYPVGPISLSGCSGLEILPYTQVPQDNGLQLYFMNVRNSGDVDRMVTVHVVRQDGGAAGNKTIRVPAQDVQITDIDLNKGPPRSVVVVGCA